MKNKNLALLRIRNNKLTDRQNHLVHVVAAKCFCLSSLYSWGARPSDTRPKINVSYNAKF